MAGKILVGVKVLELCGLVAGPYCAKLLADLGADTIKIEPPGSGDEARGRGPFPRKVAHAEKSGLFLYVNTNKRGITLDVRAEAGRQIFRKLVDWSDILIEDNPPREMEEMNLRYQDLKALNPGLIMISITPFGQTGPYRDYKAYPLNSFHAGGEPMLMYLMSPPTDRAPVNAPSFMGEYDSGLCAAEAALVALYVRGAGGPGQHVDISKQESAIALDRLENVLYHNREKEETKEMIQAAAQGYGMVGGLLSCKDGYVVLAAMQDNQWEGLVDLMGHPEWMRDEKYSTELNRAINAREATAKVQEWMSERTMREIFRGGQKRGVPVGSVNSPEDLIHTPQLRMRGFFADIEHPAAGRIEYPTAPYRFSRTPWSAVRPAPLLGQHNEEIYKGMLGFTEDEIAALKQQEII